MKIVIDNAIPYISGVLEPYATVVYRPAAEISHEDAVDADMLIIRTRTRCDRHLLEGSRVRLIATATIGFDHIDLDYCAAHGIEVVTAQGCNAAGVLQWVGAALAALAADEGWQPQQKTLGIVGGISILGNSGIVRPYSNAAYAATVALQLRAVAAQLTFADAWASTWQPAGVSLSPRSTKATRKIMTAMIRATDTPAIVGLGSVSAAAGPNTHQRQAAMLTNGLNTR